MTNDKKGKATETELGALHGKITETISRKLDAPLRSDDGKAIDGTEGLAMTAADLSNAIAWMKHNSITADPEQNDALAKLREKLKQRGKGVKAVDIAAAQNELERELGLGGATGPMQ